MKPFIFTVVHDHESFIVIIEAESKKQAIQILLDGKGCLTLAKLNEVNALRAYEAFHAIWMNTPKNHPKYGVVVGNLSGARTRLHEAEAILKRALAGGTPS